MDRGQTERIRPQGHLPPGPVAMQLGLAGGWRHTDALFCLLGRPGMSERAMSFPPRKGPPGAMVFSQFPWKGTATTPCPQHVLEAGTLSRAQAHGRSARWPLRICPGLRGASTLPGQPFQARLRRRQRQIPPPAGREGGRKRQSEAKWRGKTQRPLKGSARARGAALAGGTAA